MRHCIVCVIVFIAWLSSPACVRAQANTDYTLAIPTIFTPNGDGINDSLFITTTNIKSYTWSIYNRYGRIIIEIDNKLPKWSGNNTIGDQPTDEGFYYYTLNALTTNNVSVARTGWLFIIR